jgi:hypothetical protein
MALPTSVDNQITDSVTQANTKVLGDAPTIALGNLYQATAQALANAANNATNGQQQSQVTAQGRHTHGRGYAVLARHRLHRGHLEQRQSRQGTLGTDRLRRCRALFLSALTSLA